ncbi:hypothetical protein [Sporosarcina jiandibaonis]|uniref:hypothetical protein n=1 Tax=Sporosarcina jiandibaonis TaxID=2715535 RepID=UPI001FE63325|nr:hypothetical protein [Sporosarcina jiandibaonis]
MKPVFSLCITLLITVLVGCQLHQAETMSLLEEKVAEIKLSKSNEFDGMNEDILHSFSNDESITLFEEAIATARKQVGIVDVTEPEYDVMVVYVAKGNSQLPIANCQLMLCIYGWARKMKKVCSCI